MGKRKERTRQSGLRGPVVGTRERDLEIVPLERPRVRSSKPGLSTPTSFRKKEVSGQIKDKTVVDLKQGDHLSRFALDHPNFSSPSATSQETPRRKGY